MSEFIVPIITSFYEYVQVTADSRDEAVEIAKDAGGTELKSMTEFREVIAIGEDAGEIVEIDDEGEVVNNERHAS